MLTITTRDATPKERQELTPQLPGPYKRFENFVMGYIVVVAILQVLPPFDEAIWESGNYPFNGDILDQRIDEIL